MKKYTVTVRETALYELEVEAENAGQAEEYAVQDLINAEDMNQFFVSVEDREAQAHVK